MQFLYPLVGLLALSFGAGAQAPKAPLKPSPLAATGGATSALDAPLFHQLLMGELQVQSGEPGIGFELMLDAARKTDSAQLYQRAVTIALQARSGEPALQAAKAWQKAQPNSREAHRQALQILLALNRTSELAEALRLALANTPAAELAAEISVLPRLFTRVQDRKLASQVVEQALEPHLKAPATSATAWSTLGHFRLQAGDTSGALEAARRGHQSDPRAQSPALLALDLMQSKQPEAENLVRRVLATAPLPELRLLYARTLLSDQRHADALEQLRRVTVDQPDLAQAWLVLGSLQAQDNHAQAAQVSLERFLTLAAARPNAQELRPGETQAYLVLAQLAEKRGDYPGAVAWLNKITDSGELISAQTRRASILARQGKMDEARKLINDLPERNAGDARLKLTATVQLLRENKQPRLAYDLLGQAMARDPRDTDLAYDRAMLAEKMGLFDEMESLLKQVLLAKPEEPGAYNALGYSLADRNQRLPEARRLIEKARALAPKDPFIQDSLGWLEFRVGNKALALSLLQDAYKTRPDAEIAAHLGEVLWTMDQQVRAKAIWREGLLIAPDNETLTETLRRLRVTP